jgi:hypothetical protein
MNIRTLGALAVLALATTAQAQDSSPSIVFGVKTWNSQWTTFVAREGGVIQEPANNKLIALPQVGVRWRNFVASISGMAETDYAHGEGAELKTCSRQEQDANLGYYVLPGLVATVGYKRFRQNFPGGDVYDVRGPTLGLSATTHIAGALSTYGALGIGRMKTSLPDKNNADYHLTEVGLAYAVPAGGLLRAVSITGGYRMQVITARNLLLQHTMGGSTTTHRMDGRDITQGFTLGVVASF